MARQRQKRTKRQADPALVLARTITTRAQARKGAFVIADVANFTVADQRDMESLKRTKTIRRTPKLTTLVNSKAITPSQAQNCQWYIDRFCEAYEAVPGQAASYVGAGSRGTPNYGHDARTTWQIDARQRFAKARAAISPGLVFLFEKVVLHSRPVGRLGISFRTAVEQLEAHLVSIGEAV